MAFDFNKVIINDSISSSTSNFNNPTSTRIKDAVKENSDFKSITVNTLLYKLSSSLNYIQQNGAIQYIKGKYYSINSIVSVLFLDTSTNILHSTLLRCISTNIENYCDVIPNTNFTEDENGNIIFNGNNWNSLYWEELSKNGETDLILNVQDFEFNYQNSAFSRDNSQVKTIELFDFSNIAEDDYTFVNFTLQVNRYNNIYCNCILSGNSRNMKFQIETISNVSNTVKLGSGTFWYDSSIFRELAVNGLIFSVDEVNARLYLHYLGAEVKNKDEFQVRLYINKGNAPIVLKQLNLTNFIDNNDYVIIPFIKNASNDFSGKCGSILDYAYSLDYSEMFKNGLKEITSEETLDKWLYPIARKIKDIQFKIYNTSKRYKIFLSDGSRYRDKLFPNIKGSAAPVLSNGDGCTGAYYKGDRTTYGPGMYTDNATSITIVQATDTSRTNPNRTDKDKTYFLYKTINPDDGSVTGWLQYTDTLDASNFFNSNPDEPDRLTTASIKTIPYIKLW